MIEKKVSEYELFYDLIFVYALSRLTEVLIVGENQLISLRNTGQFLMITLVFWTIWTYQTVFANRFFARDKTNILFLFFDLFWVIVLSQAINVNFEETHLTFAGATSILFLSIAGQYYLKMRSIKDEVTKNLCKQLAVILCVNALIGFLTIYPVIPYTIRFFVYVLSIIATAVVPIIMRTSLKPFPTNFAHLSERYSLFTLLVFGQGIVIVAQTISFHYVSIGSILFFFLIMLLFIFYMTNYRSGIDKERETAGLVLIYSHYFILVGLEMSLVLYGNYVKSQINPLFFVLLLGVNLLLFLGGTLANSLVYGKKQEHLSLFLSKNFMYFVVWLAISLILRERLLPFLIVNLIWLLFVLYKTKQEIIRS